MIIKSTLRNWHDGDYRLSNVTDGAAALDYLNRRAPYQDVAMPDLILLDLNIPKMSGLEVLEAIKADERLKTIPVVVLTTTKRESDIKACYQRGANSFVAKVGEYANFKNVMQSLYTYWMTYNQRPPQIGY